MAKMTASTSVPKSMQATYEAITALTDAFCRDHLNEDYRELARRMTAALCRKRPSPLASGQPRTWACGIIYVLGQINFLTDPSTQPFMTTADLCARFGAWIMMRSATDLGKADLHVFSKLFADGLERGQEAEALPGRQMGGHDDALDFLVGHLINVEMTRQPAP